MDSWCIFFALMQQDESECPLVIPNQMESKLIAAYGSAEQALAHRGNPFF
jgi:hypothetical protein